MIVGENNSFNKIIILILCVVIIILVFLTTYMYFSSNNEKQNINTINNINVINNDDNNEIESIVVSEKYTVNIDKSKLSLNIDSETLEDLYNIVGIIQQFLSYEYSLNYSLIDYYINKNNDYDTIHKIISGYSSSFFEMPKDEIYDSEDCGIGAAACTYITFENEKKIEKVYTFIDRIKLIGALEITIKKKIPNFWNFFSVHNYNHNLCKYIFLFQHIHMYNRLYMLP